VSVPFNPATDRKFAHFAAPCPTCAQLLIDRLHALRHLAGGAAEAYMDANGCRYPDPKLEALEARIETIAGAVSTARLYQACNRASGWPRFGAGDQTRVDPPLTPHEFCPVFLPGPLDAPLTIRERDSANVTIAMCHAAPVRTFLNSLGVTYAT
jgi:hypothetical protein